jgi:tetratricopeptide (TPR) repeat protein
LNYRLFWIHLVVLLLLGSPGFASFTAAADADSTNEPLPHIDLAVRAKKIFLTARSRYHSETNNPEAAWQFSRACFDLGEFATTDSDREDVAKTGIAVAKRLIAQHPESAEAHYYLGMNLGQLARTKTLGALPLVDQMEVEFSAALKRNPKLDHAGPDRNLGMLYLEAPSFGSIGSRSKARQHLRRAVELAPDYPENRLILIEAYARWNDHTLAAREFKILADNWESAKKTYNGEEWAASWLDWNKRFQKLKAQFSEASKQLETPRH